MQKKLIKNSCDYWVTDTGRVFRGDRELAKNKMHNGYITVSIKYEGGSRKVQYVHRLVAEHFILNPEDKPVVNHKNLVKNDNRVVNLEWVTYQENNRHAHENGAFRRARGQHHHAIHSDELIHEICRLFQEGRRKIDIERRMGVDKGLLENIYRKKAWAHISKDYVFPKLPKNRKLSDQTVEWVCRKIAEGLGPKEIEDLSNGKVPSRMVSEIKNKKTYRDISDNYF